MTKPSIIVPNYDPIASFKNGMRAGPPWESIVDFATHQSFCGKRLYPRQMTLLKLIYLETETMTDYDHDVIGGWAEGFKDYNHPCGVQPDIWDRIAYLKANNFTHFPHVQMVMGRRASKGILGGILGAERIAYLYSLGDWQQHFNQVPGQVAEVAVVATSLGQAVTRQFRDIRNTVLNCEYLKQHVVADKQCVDEDTEILTKRGWLKHAELREGDETLGLHEDGTVSWTRVNRVSRYPGHHDMVRWKSRGHDSLTTPNHRWLVEWWGNRPENGGMRWTRSDKLGDKANEAVITGRGLIEYPEQKYTDALVELVAWYWTEGHLNKWNGISISQNRLANPEKWASIRAALISCFGEAKDSGSRGREFYIGSKDGKAEQIWRHAPGKDKVLSLDFILSLTKAQLQLFIDTSIAGDGHVYVNKDGKVTQTTIFQKRKDSLDTFQIACQLLGKQTTLMRQAFGRTSFSHGEEDGWRLCIYSHSRVLPASARKTGKINEVTYDGIVWCPSTETGTWLARRDGTVYFTGNTEFYVRTPGDEETIAENKLAGISTEREIATIYCKASSAVSSSGRGGTGLFNAYDEMAHMIAGTGSTKTGEEIYDAFQPSLDQFGPAALTYVASSPFCLAPETPVLTDDLRWVPVSNLAVGDKIVAFDEEIPGGKGSYRAWRQAEVTETTVIQAPRYEITMESGKKITATAEHMWLTKRVAGMGRGKGRGQRSQSFSQNWCWIKVKDLQPGDSIKSIGVDPWETDDTREGGYLAGVFDGEGHLSGAAGGQSCLGFAQNPGLVLDETQRLLAERGFDFRDSVAASGNVKMYLNGGQAEIMRFLGTVRPHRLLNKFSDFFYGRRAFSRSSPAVDRVVSVEYKDHGPVVALGTSTSTLIADGLFSHNSKIGKFYDLYQQGRITMDDYNQREGKLKTSSFIEEAAAQDIDLDPDDITAAVAEPTFLIVQLPSWEPYRDWERSREILIRPGRTRHFPRWNSPVQFEPKEEGSPDEKVQFRRRQRNPDKFKVERGAQFASVQDAYLNEVMVDRMFLPPDWREPLVQQHQGILALQYRAHADPSRTNANFGFCIGHLEDAPPDEHGIVWPHVVIDVLHVWKPENFPHHTIDYVQVGEELDDYLTRFPSMTKMSYDQFNSAGFIAHQKRAFPNIRILEKTFTVKENQDRFEKFKSALNLGWVHAPKDHFAEDGHSLLELELKFLQEKNGKVDRQEIGPVQTKDLADAVMVVTVELLHESLDRWWKAINRTSVGSTNVDALRSGREQERLMYHESSKERYTDPLQRFIAEEADKAERKSLRAERNKATLEANKAARGRRNSLGSRVPYNGDRTRGYRN